MSNKLVLLATERYSINVNDLYMFFRRSDHEIVALVHHVSCPEKPWWVNNSFPDPSRDRLFDPMEFDRLRLMPWSSVDELLAHLDALEFDHVCMGNGSGTEQQQVIRHIGRDKCLFTEYGWLPWSRHFYISRKGCGYASEITDIDEAALDRQPIREQEILNLRRMFGRGWPVLRRDFIYVPLQKDVNDFKFTSSQFACNEEFLDFIHEIVPPKLKVLVREHPLYRKHYDLRKYGRFIDISGKRISKVSIYRHMRAMIAINSTSIVEAILFAGKVFAYGQDLFLNKGLVHFRVNDPQEFIVSLEEPQGEQRCKAFVSLLLERQIDRRRCLRDDLEYVRNHYWNQAL